MTHLLMLLDRDRPYAEALQAAGVDKEFQIHVVKPTEAVPPDVLERAEAMIAMTAPAGMLSRMPRLRWIQALTVGVDGWLARPDLATSHALTAARGTHRVQMPENILGALFHLTKPYHLAAVDQASSTWTRRISTPLAGKTLGILGLGAIGQELARKAAALELRVIGTKRQASPVPFVDRVYGSDETEAVLRAADFVVLLLPLTGSTDKLMDADRLKQMKPSAYLLNFGRGGLVDDDALIAACEANTIAGAVLDVFRQEPLPATHPFWRTRNVTVLPHIGGLHPERDKVVGALFAENAKRFLAGKPLRELVDRDRGY